MGPKHSQNNQFSEDKLNKNHFEFLHVVGKGGFGKVWKVLFKKNKKPFALKEMSKVKIIDRKSERSIMYERELLAKLKHPFIVNMQYAFQDYDNLYLVMDLLTGGDLRYHISRHKRFSEEQTRFFVACIVLGLEYVHTNKVLHRDIKPENLVLDERGYVRITDFGVAKLFQKENSSETSGTPGYMAPEVMCAQNHSYFVDYFAVGVIAFEFMYGVRPYLGKSRKEIKDLILAKQVQIKPNDIPEGWSIESADFINKMLQRKPVNRLGYNGTTEIKEHPWLKYYPWKDLYEKNLEAPFAPKNIDNFDKKYCEGPDKIGNDTLERYQNYYKNEALNDIFINYSFENLLSVQTAKKETKRGINSGNSNHNTYLNNVNNTSTKKRINSSLSNLNNLNKNSLNNLLKNKMKITESLYLNNPNANVNVSNISKNTPLKNNRTNSLNMNINPNMINTPNHIRNMSNSNMNSHIISNYQSMNINNGNTPNKNRSLNNINLLKSRGKNLSMNSSTNVSNLNIANSSAINSAMNNMNINVNNSTNLMNLKSTATPFRNGNGEKVNEKLPFIEQKLANSRQFSSNITIPKKIINSPSIKTGISTNISNNLQNGPKTGTKYTTLSANSTGSSTISMNFLHRRSGSTNTFNNY